MLIHFDVERRAGCDDCENPRTMMHLYVKHLDRAPPACSDP
jgi:hypothetical protein